jgi:hypothetical protein
MIAMTRVKDKDDFLEHGENEEGHANKVPSTSTTTKINIEHTHEEKMIRRVRSTGRQRSRKSR